MADNIFCSIIGLVICIFTFVRKTVSAVENFSENAFRQFENFGDSLSKLESIDTHQANGTSEQITLLKSYLTENVVGNEPELFYTYLGFEIIIVFHCVSLILFIA